MDEMGCTVRPSKNQYFNMQSMVRLVSVMSILILPYLGFGQAVTADVSLGVGISKYFGDMDSGNILKDFAYSSPAVQLRFNIKHNGYFGTNIGILAGGIKGDDERSLEQSRRDRNLNFFSPLYEASIVEEFHLLGNARMNKHGWSPYVFAGIAGYYFNPKTRAVDGQVYALQPLGTEGQGAPGYEEPYSRYRLSIPLGAGARFQVAEQILISTEVGIRLTGFDYLDDVSTSYVPRDVLLENGGSPAVELSDRRNNPMYTGQRGDFNDNDYYLMIMVNFHYTFVSHRTSRIKCPLE